MRSKFTRTRFWYLFVRSSLRAWVLAERWNGPWLWFAAAQGNISKFSSIIHGYHASCAGDRDADEFTKFGRRR
jgi:hypothetical protein